jgi:hypothetical protein
VISLIDAVLREMGMTYDFVDDRALALNGAPNPILVGDSPTVDVSLVDTANENAWSPGGMAGLARTVNLFSTEYSGVQYMTTADTGIFRMFAPFANSMWLALVIAMVSSGFVMALLKDLHGSQTPCRSGWR